MLTAPNKNGRRAENRAVKKKSIAKSDKGMNSKFKFYTYKCIVVCSFAVNIADVGMKKKKKHYTMCGCVSQCRKKEKTWQNECPKLFIIIY